jgi:hypothetical protein
VAVQSPARQDSTLSNTARKDLHALVDAVPASEEQAARRYLEDLRDASDPYTSLDKDWPGGPKRSLAPRSVPQTGVQLAL